MKLRPIIPPLAFASLGLAAAFILPGCSGEDARVAPLKSEMEAHVKAAISPFLSLADLETEVIPVKENRVKISFKAKVKASEDLFIADRRIEDDRQLMILKKSQASGAEANLYGSMFAERMMDKWDISPADIESGMAQLGSPRGSFDPRAMVDGSPEMKQFFADREAERAALAKAEEEQARKSEEARLALLEEKRSAREATRKKLTEATAVGKRYRGILVQSPGSREVRQAVELQFTSQSGALITAELHNPDEPSHKQTFTGELVFEPEEEGNRSNERLYPIVLSPTQAKKERVSENERDRFRIYFEECVLKLGLTNEGLEGEATTKRYGIDFALRMQTAE